MLRGARFALEALDPVCFTGAAALFLALLRGESRLRKPPGRSRRFLCFVAAVSALCKMQGAALVFSMAKCYNYFTPSATLQML